jgi:deferrochelatase/peroxidase EfeB
VTHFQAGILNRPPDHALFVSLELVPTEQIAAHAAIKRLRSLIKEELSSDLPELVPSLKEQEPAETGELGFKDDYDRYHLTVTVGFSSTAYDKLGVTGDDRPQDVRPIPWNDLGDQPENADNGGVLLQICSDSVYIVEHVARRVEHELSSEFRVVWAVQGAQRHTSRAGRISRTEGRALIGFLDGTSNLNPRHSDDDKHLVFVDQIRDDMPPRVPPVDPNQPPAYGQPTPAEFPPELHDPPGPEPAWVVGGTYAVVRASTIAMSDWDHRTLGVQEHTIGRWKLSGSGLDQADDPNVNPQEPVFADADGATTPLTAHIRKANPRGPGDEKRRVFRRGYPLVLATAGGGIALGLIFACFARTITTQFEFITRAWTTNPNFPSPGAGVDAFRQFEHVLCGGYFFVPPLDDREPWSWHVPDASQTVP